MININHDPWIDYDHVFCPFIFYFTEARLIELSFDLLNYRFDESVKAPTDRAFLRPVKCSIVKILMKFNWSKFSFNRLNLQKKKGFIEIRPLRLDRYNLISINQTCKKSNMGNEISFMHVMYNVILFLENWVEKRFYEIPQSFIIST